MLSLSLAVFAIGIKKNYAAGTTDVVGAPLVEPIECTSTFCDLTFGVVRYEGPTNSFLTRGYNGAIPGPTLRISPGASLHINVVNDLEDHANFEGVMNQYRCTFSCLFFKSISFTNLVSFVRKPNSTNVHTHGLHASSAAPGDDPFIEISPQSSYAYHVQIPPDHMV